jgi:hypothetical protein
MLIRTKGPRQGYFPEPSKSILIVREHNKEAAQESFKDLGFTIVTGSRYFGGFIGEAPNQLSWIQEKNEDWVDSIKELAMVAECYGQAAYAGLHYGQEAYTGLQKSLQQEWQSLQCVTKRLGKEFRDIEKALQMEFLPALFSDDLTNDLPGQLVSLPVKKAGCIVIGLCFLYVLETV